MGLQHDTTIWKTDSLTIPFKTALLLYDTAVMILGIFKSTEKTHVTQKPKLQKFRSFIHNCCVLMISSNRCMYKQTMVHPDN